MSSVIARSVSSIEQFWSDKTRQLQLFKLLEKKLQIEKPNDWYNFKTNDLVRWDYRATALLEQYDNSLTNLLSTFYPEVKWDPEQ
jgi:hypothetical protein